MDTDTSSAPPAKSVLSSGNKAWANFQQSFTQVQYILDHNRLLINEINQNHQSRIPESLSRNVSLTRELNNNITKVVELYANISEDFAKVFEIPSDSPGAASNASEGGSAKPLPVSQGNKISRS
ncbi:unnamed protein product [Calypogeia fissa]